MSILIKRIEDIPKELRLNVRLIKNGKSITGKDKLYDKVAGCLLAFSCNLAFKKKSNKNLPIK